MYKEKRINSGMIASIVLVAALILFIFHTRPAQTGLASLKAQVDTLTKEVNTILAANETRDTDPLLSEVEEKELAQAVPIQLEQDILIKNLNTLSKEADVEFTSLSFTLQKNATLPTVVISAGFQGTYGNLTRFLKMLEVNSRKIIVRDASISRSGTGEGELELINLNVTLHSFFRDLEKPKVIPIVDNATSQESASVPEESTPRPN